MNLSTQNSSNLRKSHRLSHPSYRIQNDNWHLRTQNSPQKSITNPTSLQISIHVNPLAAKAVSTLIKQAYQMRWASQRYAQNTGIGVT